MTDLKDALIDLLAKVEVGAFKWNAWAKPPLDRALMGKVEDAYYGSLDAAKALHEAVLHERVSKHEMWSMRYGSSVKLKDANVVLGSGSDDDGNSARAWLIAILKALISNATAT
jgi:hypothetical protein